MRRVGFTDSFVWGYECSQGLQARAGRILPAWVCVCMSLDSGEQAVTVAHSRCFHVIRVLTATKPEKAVS